MLCEPRVITRMPKILLERVLHLETRALHSNAVRLQTQENEMHHIHSTMHCQISGFIFLTQLASTHKLPELFFPGGPAFFDSSFEKNFRTIGSRLLYREIMSFGISFICSSYVGERNMLKSIISLILRMHLKHV